MRQWLFDKIVVEKFNNFFGLLILLIFSLAAVVAIAHMGVKGGVMIFSLIVGIPIVLYSLGNNRFAYMVLIVFTTFMAFVTRLFSIDVPFGVGIDAFLLLLLFGIIVEYIFSQNRASIAKEFSFTNPISIAIIVWTAYLLLQVGNPSGTLAGYMFGLRNILRGLVTFIIAQRVFNRLGFVHFFVTFFVALGVIIAVYGIYQEFAGLPSYDLKWATLTKERINLLFIQGKWRKWSVLSDPAIFGLMMSFGGIVACLMALGPFTWRKKLFFVCSGLLMLLAMFFSGTRTAYVMIPIALGTYVIINIAKIKTLVFACVSALVFLVIYFGPFYSKPIVRFRSAFNPSEDASMNLREYNRERIRPYVHSHPIGGGLTTTGGYGERFSPGHPLSGFPPDGGFMKTLLETGWIGLLIEMGVYFTILAVGMSNYYNSRDPVIKTYYAAFAVSFFALTIALYAKENIFQFPLNFILYGIFVMMYKLRKFDSGLISKHKYK